MKFKLPDPGLAGTLPFALSFTLTTILLVAGVGPGGITLGKMLSSYAGWVFLALGPGLLCLSLLSIYHLLKEK